MIIKILGPVGSGKSTISKKLAEKLEVPCIPEFEEGDLTFHRLLKERNIKNTAKAKVDFQNYTFEQAYRRQRCLKSAVIDTPLYQHILMAEQSLSAQQYVDYLKNYFDKIHESKYENEVVFILYLPFEQTIERIKKRGREEETLSKEELEFYSSFYDSLYSNWVPYLKNSILIDASKDPDTIVEDMIKELVGYEEVLSTLNETLLRIKDTYKEIEDKVVDNLNEVISLSDKEDTNKKGVLLDTFYRPDRNYWYKLIESEDGIYHITYDYEEASIRDVVEIKSYNRLYSYGEVLQAQKIFNMFREKYK